jgi:pyruvate kinase
MNKTKIVCTIGPASISEKILLGLYSAGMSVARLNGSHADMEWHTRAIREIRRVVSEVPILFDIPGRKIRTQQLANEPNFAVGDTLTLTTDTSHDGTLKVPVNYPNLHLDLASGQTILADDGTLRFRILEIAEKDIICIAETAGQLKSRKGINVPFVQLNTPQVTLRDEEMINFARELGVDFIGLSFVESAAHIHAVRTLIDGTSPRIVAKIENQRGMEFMHEVIEAADAIMIDRGDLSVETSLHDVVIRQKAIIRVAKEFGRPVIVATEMLHTMIGNPFPTKAEVSDITNAVLDGCAATMLSGETAIGAFPIEAVKLMKGVAMAAEQFLIEQNARQPVEMDQAPQLIARSVLELSSCLPVTKIVAITRSGFAAQLIAAHGPNQPIIAVSDDPKAALAFNLINGVTGVLCDFPFARSSLDFISKLLKMLWDRGLIDSSDLILLTGLTFPTSGQRMNTIQIHNVADLSHLFGWQPISN